MRWIDDAGCWSVYKEEEYRWTPSDEDVREMGKTVVDGMYQQSQLMFETAEAEQNQDAMAYAQAYIRWTKQTATTRFDQMIKMARSEPRIRIKMKDFDSYPYFLNTPGGVWDLRSYEPVDTIYAPRLLLTKRTTAPPVEWRGGLWERFLEYVLPDPEVRRFMQLACGYAAFFGVEERLILFLIGETGHGKSKFVEAIHAALGDYAVSVPTDQFLIGAKDNYSLARLPGARWISASEFDEHAKVNVALVKRITSGEPITVRMAYGKPFDYSPGGTICVSTNHAPFLGGDSAAWARSVFVPFNVPLGLDARTLFGDEDLSAQLRDVAGEVLGWIMDGARDYWHSPVEGGVKLVRPGCVVQATEEVKADQRHYVVQCMDDLFDGDTSVYQASTDLYQMLRWWAQDEGIAERDLVRQDWMGRRLKAAGVSSYRNNHGRFWAVGRLLGDAKTVGMGFDGALVSRVQLGFSLLEGRSMTPNGDTQCRQEKFPDWS